MIPAVSVGDELVMRTFRLNVPIITGAGALVFLSFSPAPPPLQAEEGRARPSLASEQQKQDFSTLKARLDGSDRTAALRALELALSELGDGVTLVWKRPERGLVGRIKPVSAFRDDKGRVCRQVLYSLALGAYHREVEAIACREPDGSWSLAG